MQQRLHSVIVAGVLVGVFLASSSPAQEYVGHDTCQPCHSAIYDDYTDSGHPYKLNKVDGGPPEYPFSEVPSPPEGYTWDDITYVIGGYFWKARFVDTEGYIITGDEVQFNLATGDWSSYHADEDPGTKPYNCGKCHTTGWQTTEENGGARQDGLEGMAGTFAAGGVQCEGCHGPGSAHADSPSDENISVDTSKELCGRCHTRDSERRIATSGGLIKHHEQYDELVNSPHRFMDCLTCHDPHKSVVYDLGGRLDEPTCTTCHSDRAVLVSSMADHDCETCHMPLAAKSAVKSLEFAVDDDTGALGDIHSHIFKLNADPGAEMFTDGGKFVQLDDEGDAILRVEFACIGCHNGDVASAQNIDWMYDNALVVHGGGPTAIGELPSAALPADYALQDAYPNPFNPVTHVRYDLPRQEYVRIEIRDVRGALVYTLADEYQRAGRYMATWDGIDNGGIAVASGTYFMHLSSDAFSGTVKMTLLR